MIEYVRPLALPDLALMLDIERRAHSHPWTEKNFTDAFAAGYAGLGLFRGDAMLGFAWVMRALDEAELLDIAVAPEHRRAGHGQHLLVETCARLRQHGVRALHLEVRASNVSARALYAQAGFVGVGVRVGYYPCGNTDGLGNSREDAILMRKEWADANAG